MPARKTKQEIKQTQDFAKLLAFVERRSLWIAGALVLLATARIAATYPIFSHTFDEPAHLACGMEWIEEGVYRWEAQHPPLARVAAAIGPYLSGIRSSHTPHSALRTPDDVMAMYREGAAMLFRGDQYDRTLMLARLGMLPFFWIACFAVYWWGARFFGRAVGVAALFFFSFMPPILGHAGLATTDIALTGLLSATFIAGLVWIDRPTRANALWFGAATGLMILSKFSSLAFLPASALVALAWYWIAERPKSEWLIRAVKERVPTFGLAVLLALVVIWAGYRFSFDRVPAPELFRGIQQMIEHNSQGHYSYLLGQRSQTGFWYFYEVALAVKTPIAFLLLLCVGCATLSKVAKRFPRIWIPLAFALGILLVGMISRVNIGIRHVLPVYAGFSVVAAATLVHLIEDAASRKWLLAAAAVLLVWFAGSSILSHPDYLAYFNEFAGSEPERILVDSDLDWGQDEKRLAQRLREVGARQVTYVPVVIGDPQKIGLPPLSRGSVTSPEFGWNAVGVTFWKQLRFNLMDRRPDVVLWPDRVKPQERIGKSILLWHFEPRK